MKTKMSCMRGEWKGVTGKKIKIEAEELALELLLSVENNKSLKSKTIGEHQSHSGHKELQGMSCRQRCFPRVKLDRTSTAKKFCAASGDMIKDLGEKTTIQVRRSSAQVHKIPGVQTL